MFTDLNAITSILLQSFWKLESSDGNPTAAIAGGLGAEYTPHQVPHNARRVQEMLLVRF